MAPQALSLFNGDFVSRQSRHLAERLEDEAGPHAERQIERAYLLALCRPVSVSEEAEMLDFLKREEARGSAKYPGRRRLLITRERVGKPWNRCAA